MKKHLLLVAFAMLGSANIFAQDVEKETLTPTADTFVRSSAADNKYGDKDALEIWTAADGTDFVGLMSFSLPEKEGYEVKSAKLVLHTERVKGDRKLTIYPFGYAINEGGDTYNTQKENIAAARGETPLVADVELNGQGGKAFFDDIADEYKNIEAWTTEFDITDYVAGIGSGDVNLMFTHNGEKGQEVKVYSKEAGDVTMKDGVTVFKGEDLVPELVVEYTPVSGNVDKETLGTTADTFVRSSAAKNKYGDKDAMEIWTASDGTDFVGLMSFTLPVKENSEISKAVLVLHAERVKGDRKLTIYPFDYAISESDDTYESQSQNIDAARQETPIIEEAELNGQGGKAVTDELADEYKTADAWKTELDVTEYVAGIGSGETGLLLCHNGEKGQEVKVYTKEVKDVTLKDGVTVFKAEDLRPKLVITYTKATGINEVETIEPVAKAKEGIYTISGVRVAKADRPGIYIINGKKVLVRNK